MLKDSVEKITVERNEKMNELKKVCDLRNAKFLEFFD